MTKWPLSNGTVIGLEGWLEAGFSLISVDLHEVLGGSFATGTIRFISAATDEGMEFVTEKTEIDMTLGTETNGTILTIHGVITRREWNKNSLTIQFVCVPDVDFMKRKTKIQYSDINTAISSLWKGKTDIRTETDVVGALDQANEFDCDFLGTVCGSYKKNSVFAIGLDGLLIKDLVGIDSKGKNEPDPETPFLSGGTMGTQDPSESSYQMTYDENLYQESKDPGEATPDDNSLYFDVKIFNNKYRIVWSDKSTYRSTLLENQRIYNSRMYNQITIDKMDYLPVEFRLGDTVIYRNPGEESKIPFDVYIISAINYHISVENATGEDNSTPFKLTYTLHCLQEKAKLLPEGEGSDPMDNDETKTT